MDPELAAALATADRQLRHIGDSLDYLVAEARLMLADSDETKVWALVSRSIRHQLELDSGRPGFAAEMLAAAILRLARRDPDVSG
jgi:hypothetical protein